MKLPFLIISCFSVLTSGKMFTQTMDNFSVNIDMVFANQAGNLLGVRDENNTLTYYNVENYTLSFNASKTFTTTQMNLQMPIQTDPTATKILTISFQQFSQHELLPNGVIRTNWQHSDTFITNCL